MSGENMNSDYINKIDNIIEFFKAEKELKLYYISMGEEDSKFKSKFYISTIVVLIAITNVTFLLKMFDTTTISFLILSILFLLFFIFIGEVKPSKRRIDYIQESVKFNMIINFFYSLKILPYEINLSPVIDTIKKRYHVKTWFIELNQKKYLDECGVKKL